MNSISIFINSRTKTGVLKREHLHIVNVKHGCSKKGYNNIFHDIVRYERMKSWVIFTQNAILLYCSFLFIENLTFPRLPFHFLSNWPPNPNPKKEKVRKVSPYLISSFFHTLSWRYFLWLAALFFPSNMKGSKRTTTRFGHLCSSTKKSKKTKKQPYDRKFVVKQYIKLL